MPKQQGTLPSQWYEYFFTVPFLFLSQEQPSGPYNESSHAQGNFDLSYMYMGLVMTLLNVEIQGETMYVRHSSNNAKKPKSIL